MICAHADIANSDYCLKSLVLHSRFPVTGRPAFNKVSVAVAKYDPRDAYDQGYHREDDEDNKPTYRNALPVLEAHKLQLNLKRVVRTVFCIFAAVLR